METQTAQNLIDEVNNWNDKDQRTIEAQSERLNVLQSNGIVVILHSNTNGLFTIPQEELERISWEELRKVSQ